MHDTAETTSCLTRRAGDTVQPMKRAVLLGSFVALLLACGPKGEPKQASIPDPEDPVESSEGNRGNSGSGNSGSASNVAPPGGGGGTGSAKGDKTPKGEAPSVNSLSTMQEGTRWGMSHADLTKMFTQNGGVIWKDYDEKLSKARVGPEMTALEAEREQSKAAFARSYLEFKDTPTGYDATNLKGEYSYKNKEALMWIQREGKKRYFFFINDRLWKIYDEVPLSDGGPMGKTFLEAANIMNGKVGKQGRVQGVDPKKDILVPTVDWKDGTSHLRLVDHAPGSVGVILEDNATLGQLASLRPNKMEDPTAIDPSITAVTGGQNRSDPNAAANAEAKPAAKGAAKGGAPKKKK